jgi:hypothetical protein
MSDKKKMSAAIAAVMYYINEEQAIQMQAASYGIQQAPAAHATAPASAIRPWGMNGRQTQMQMRNLMQMRTFQRNRGI